MNMTRKSIRLGLIALAMLIAFAFLPMMSGQSHAASKPAKVKGVKITTNSTFGYYKITWKKAKGAKYYLVRLNDGHGYKTYNWSSRSFTGYVTKTTKIKVKVRAANYKKKGKGKYSKLVSKTISIGNLPGVITETPRLGNYRYGSDYEHTDFKITSAQVYAKAIAGSTKCNIVATVKGTRIASNNPSTLAGGYINYQVINSRNEVVDSGTFDIPTIAIGQNFTRSRILSLSVSPKQKYTVQFTSLEF